MPSIAFASRTKEWAAHRSDEGEIDLLIATDCISQGENLQQRDWLMNYDVRANIGAQSPALRANLPDGLTQRAHPSHQCLPCRQITRLDMVIACADAQSLATGIPDRDDGLSSAGATIVVSKGQRVLQRYRLCK